jgi:hypothetical protein
MVPNGNAHCTIWQPNCQLSPAGFSQEFRRLTLLHYHEWQTFVPPLCKWEAAKLSTSLAARGDN